MKAFRRIIISLGTTFFAVCCGALLLFNWRALGWSSLAVPTGSMRPAMPPGSLVLVHSVPISTIKVGDVITYTNPKNIRTTVTHRIIKSEMIGGKIPAFITKGDANLSADPAVVVGGLVKGKATWHVPYLGTWLSWTKKPIGLLVVLYVPALLLMIEEVQRLSDYLKLSQPYKLRERSLTKMPEASARNYTVGIGLTALSIVAAVVIAQPALAALRSNTVTLANNRISVATVANNCSGSTTNNSNINITTNSSQTASSGNASSSDNTGGSSATSGSASNRNLTNVNVHITNCQ